MMDGAPVANARTGGETGATLGATVPPRLDATVVLVRHGESTWVAEGRVQGQSDPPLSALGREQARLVAARLAAPLSPPPLPLHGGRPAAVWHSPLSRASETAAAISGAWSPCLERAVDDRLREIGQGEWEGLTGAEVRARYPDVQRGWRTDPVHVHAPGGEPLPDVGSRACSFVDDLLSRLAGMAEPGAPSPSDAVPWAIVVAHEGLLRVLLLSLLGLPLDAFWRFPLGLCGISVIDVRGGRSSLRAHNLLDHLAPIGPRASLDATVDRGGGL
ncbi:MAG: histidine phosphatase family protein [Chloroflexi bacterium]|nr:histidine phosphatase family protein [Chloroflexota bacterium]